MIHNIKGFGGFQTPQFALNGKERKDFIKERNKLRSFIKSFSWNTSVNNDLYSIYGPEKNIIEKEEENEILRKAQVELDEMNKKLLEPYKQYQPILALDTYKQIMSKIAAHHNVVVVSGEVSFIQGNIICIAEHENEEFSFLAFFHEMGHFLDKSIWSENEKHREEKAAWFLGYKLAHKYNITFSEEAMAWGREMLESYKEKISK